MDPEKQRLDRSPRSLATDAFFASDRTGPHVDVPVFRNRYAVDTFTEQNPLPNARKTAAKNGVIDTAVAGWKHNATYTCFFSREARVLKADTTARLQVKLLFDTGSEYHRHGVCGVVDGATKPTLLIVVPGTEPHYLVEFPVDQLTQVVIFDCLYGSLKPVLDRVKALKGSAHVIAYVVTGGGNSFRPGEPVSFDSSLLGRNPSWNYVDLMSNVGFHSVTSARLVSEAHSPTAHTLDTLPPSYERALDALVAMLPTRGTVRLQ